MGVWTICKRSLPGLAAGAINGLLGAGGGMLLVPLLAKHNDLSPGELFPGCLSVMIPICLVSLTVTVWGQGLPWAASLPYLLGSAVGGVLAGTWGKRIPVLWLHRGLGLMILWGGVRYLW